VVRHVRARQHRHDGTTQIRFSTHAGSPLTIKAVFFDHDGTLVDSEPTHFRMWQDVLARHGIGLSEQQYKDYYAGVPTVANAVDMASRFAIGESHESLAEAKNAATRAFLSASAFPLMPGASDAIALLLKHGLKLAVVTGAGRNGVQATLRAYALQSMFATIVSGDDVRKSKPAPDCYLLAMERLGLAASECLAIEDTEHGVKAATSAGIASVAVPTVMSRHHDFSQAAGVFGHLGEAMAWIETRFTLCPQKK
jgi:HAD superfamily hydrolase (TIGR01509 family)